MSPLRARAATLVTVIAFTLPLFAGPAASQDRKVDIVNETGVSMTGFFTSRANAENWEDNLLGNDVLQNGETLEAEIDDRAGHCLYDFKAEFLDGDIVIKRKVNVCEINEFTFTP